MFFMNSHFSNIILDWKYLESASLVLKAVLKTNKTVFILSMNDDEISGEIKKFVRSKKVVLVSDNTSTVSKLSKFISLSASCQDSVFITSDLERLRISNELPVGTVLVKKSCAFEDARSGADYITTPSAIHRLFEADFYASFAGESALIDIDSRKHLPGYSADKTLLVKILNFETDHQELGVSYSLGRYFLKDDPSKNGHIFTRFIKVFKEDPVRFSEQLKKMLSQGIKYAAKNEGAENCIVTWVPKKPSDKFDRNRKMLETVAKLGYPIKSLLICTDDFPSQKSIVGSDKRRKNVKGKFKARKSIQSLPVILIDDVYTSGATLAECAEALLAAGASRVVSLTLALSTVSTSTEIEELKCGQCGASLYIQFNKKDGKAFWGCPNWSQNESGSHTTLNYVTGIQRLRNAKN